MPNHGMLQEHAPSKCSQVHQPPPHTCPARSAPRPPRSHPEPCLSAPSTHLHKTPYVQGWGWGRQVECACETAVAQSCKCRCRCSSTPYHTAWEDRKGKLAPDNNGRACHQLDGALLRQRVAIHKRLLHALGRGRLRLRLHLRQWHWQNPDPGWRYKGLSTRDGNPGLHSSGGNGGGGGGSNTPAGQPTLCPPLLALWAGEVVCRDRACRPVAARAGVPARSSEQHAWAARVSSMARQQLVGRTGSVQGFPCRASDATASGQLRHSCCGEAWMSLLVPAFTCLSCRGPHAVPCEQVNC